MAISLRLPLLIRTLSCIALLTIFEVSGLFQPVCDISPMNPGVNDVITLTCKPAEGDSLVAENITLTWFHDGQNISTEQQSGVVRTKLSAADYGVTFTCREALATDNEANSCAIMPLMRATPTPGTPLASEGASSSDTPMSTHAMLSKIVSDDPRQGTITILFIAIVVAGGLPILIAFVACIVWIARKTKGDHNSYDLTNAQRPRSDSFDDFDPETAVDGRPAAPLPGSQLHTMTSVSSVKNGGPPPVLRSLVEKESFYSNTPGAENPYQNTAMGSSTLPVLSKNIYLVPNCSPGGSKEDLDDDVKIYENTAKYGNKQHRFETDHTASLPNFRY